MNRTGKILLSAVLAILVADCVAIGYIVSGGISPYSLLGLLVLFYVLALILHLVFEVVEECVETSG
ncbi:MAG: hypothetical protein JRD89_19230 [Deltaproteobacteria bacterium]|nr:hypothetical protein [Deltaproteobacteria bacterium]